MFADKKVNAYVTIKKWRDAGLKLPAEGHARVFSVRGLSSEPWRLCPGRPEIEITNVPSHDRVETIRTHGAGSRV